MTIQVTKDFENKRLIVERSYRASAAVVWACWTEARHLRRWWGPHGWLVDVFELDLRPGGLWRYRLRPEGEHELEDEQWGLYRVVEEPRRLEFDDGFSDPAGALVAGSSMPTAVLIRTDDDRTNVSITVTFAGADELAQAEAIGMVEGFSDALNRLGTLTTEMTETGE
jgi:uncharacterized protein YndB with AHSA1/START domain